MRKESKYNKMLIDFSEEILENDKTLSIRVSGISMYPSLKEGDICYEEKCSIEDLNIGDIIVCRRGNFFIMHRLRKLYKENGKYVIIMRGDNVPQDDPPFTEEQFVARVLYFKRNGKTYQIDSPKMKFFKFLDDYFHPITSRINRAPYISKIYIKHGKELFHSIYNNLRALLQGQKKLFRINAFIAVLKGFVPLAMIVSIRFLIDFINRGSLQTSEQKYLFVGLLLLTAILFMATSVLNQIGNYFTEKMSQNLSRKVYAELQKKHIRLHLTDFENSDKQDKMHRAVQEASYRPTRMLNSALTLIKTISSGIILFLLIVSIRWYLVFILLAAVLPEALFRVFYVRRLYRTKEAQIGMEREKHYYNRVLTGFTFAKEMRLFNFSGYFIRRFKQKQDKLFAENLALTKFETRTSILTQAFGVLLIFGAIGIVAYQSMTGAMSIGTIVLFFFAFRMGYGMLNEFFRAAAGLIEDNTFLEDYLNFLQLPDAKTDKIASPKPFQLNREIRFENVCFAYENSERKALKNVNLYIPKGKTVALVGENGAGKTTLIKLLCGFYKPSSGKITLDQVDISSIGMENILKNLTAVFQDFALYQVAAGDNIMLGDYKKPRDLERMKQSAQIAGIDEAISKMPKGYGSRLGYLFKDSEELSIGQWQKMAIARAFYRNAPLLIMDEPSSALDPNSERQIVSTLKKLAENKTTLIVSHRLSTVQWADYIYLINNGQVAEEGTHNELMERKGLYYNLFQTING